MFEMGTTDHDLHEKARAEKISVDEYLKRYVRPRYIQIKMEKSHPFEVPEKDWQPGGFKEIE